MRQCHLEVCGRRYPAVAAESFLDRLLGVHRIGDEIEAVVIAGSSVHGLTVRRPLWVAGLDELGRGVGWRLLRPGRVVRIPGAVVIAEFPRGLACGDRHRSHTIRRRG